MKENANLANNMRIVNLATKRSTSIMLIMLVPTSRLKAMLPNNSSFIELNFLKKEMTDVFDTRHRSKGLKNILISVGLFKVGLLKLLYKFVEVPNFVFCF